MYLYSPSSYTGKRVESFENHGTNSLKAISFSLVKPANCIDPHTAAGPIVPTVIAKPIPLS